ncbi:MAG: CRISPR-associated helicase Cas3' [Bacillota bacterium]
MSTDYLPFFKTLTGHLPHPYQVGVANSLFAGRNLVVRAPTGCGKTLSVLGPFLFPAWQDRPRRLLYALPLRTLAQGIYAEACVLAERAGLPPDRVTLQTGEQPDDPFFDLGDIIITTYDQLLSGLLCGPYGKSARLHNINAAATVGTLVVFDEYHLMEPARAFLTAVAGLKLFEGLVQSVWMTATATAPLDGLLAAALDCALVSVSEAEQAQIPAIAAVQRELVVEDRPLTAEAVLSCHQGRSLVILNTVARAQAMAHALQASSPDVATVVLHSRFFRQHRRAKEEELRRLLGRGSSAEAIVVTTQVVEAGLDISADTLHTELCPVNSLVQRAGRCARFRGEQGTVHVYPLTDEPRSWLPYGDERREDPTLTATHNLLAGVKRASLAPGVVADWVQQVHAETDALGLRDGVTRRVEGCAQLIERIAVLREPTDVSDLIRAGENTLYVILGEEQDLPPVPAEREGLSLRRWSLAGLLQAGSPGWYWTADGDWAPWTELRQLAGTYAVCLRTASAAYDSTVGLRLGEPGDAVSPPRALPPKRAFAPTRKESWPAHTEMVAAMAGARLAENDKAAAAIARRYGLAPSLLAEAVRVTAAAHDVGKLQRGWQAWAEEAQRLSDPSYVSGIPLAHTDSQPGPRCETEHIRPPHAAASAYYSLPACVAAFRQAQIPLVTARSLVAACLAAALAHHGGWLPRALDLGVQPLVPGAANTLSQVGLKATADELAGLARGTDKRGVLEHVLSLALSRSGDSLQRWWPLVAYLTRVLRLSDWRATEEGGTHE